MTSSVVRDVLRWDVASWKGALAFWERRIPQDRPLECLEIGGGEGGLSLWLALRRCAVTCSDLHDTARTARPLHVRYGVDPLVRYENLDATAIPFVGRFDVVVFKSVLGAVGRAAGRHGQARAVAEMHKALRPGGVLLFAENARASIVHAQLRRRFVRWGRDWRYVTLADMQEFLASFRQVELHTTGVVGAFGITERQRRVLAALDRVALNRAVPDRFRYIVYGAAVK